MTSTMSLPHLTVNRRLVLRHGTPERVNSMHAQLWRHELDPAHSFFTGDLPAELRLSPAAFDKLWAMHPDTYHRIRIHGRLVPTPRFQQAYGKDYHYTGNTNRAMPVPDLLRPLVAWCQSEVDDRLNGLLLNWYDASLGHYIGKHRDSTKNMLDGAPIVTVSFGAERTFRLRPWKGRGFRDFPATDGSLFVMPYGTNRAWTHEVPRSLKRQGRRISVTLRAFAD